MTILEARGLFWWADDPIPPQQFAPNSCETGLLKVDADGSCSLELDSYLPSEHGAMSALLQCELPAHKCIQGLLKGSDQHILLVGPIRNGGQMQTKGISFERYIAAACLISEGQKNGLGLVRSKYVEPAERYRRNINGHQRCRTSLQMGP